ncbi:serine hydrolase [Sphingomicrobium sp. XHP0239]|uniref:serine hydrolase domain-containing protein n=1 Tax=Sphingomicrobium maritimum TaxID=3133972 RepID=UPI0031CCA2A0
MRFPLLLAALTLLSCDNEPTMAVAASEDARTTREATTTGLDPEQVDQLIERAASLSTLEGLLVLRDGETLIEERFNGGPPLDAAVNIKSASKSVISALVGIAIDRGILDGTDQKVLSLLADDAPSDPDPRLRELDIGHLLSMQAGLERTSGDNYGRWVSSGDWVDYALSRPFVADPGGRMLYSTGSTHLLSAMLTEASGRSTWELARDWLGMPLDIAIPQWERDQQGIYLGGNQMSMSPRGMARFGELYRLGGTISGNEIVPSDWIEASWTPRTRSPWSGEQYGYGWFLTNLAGHPVRYAWGYGGQMIFIVPDLALTVVMTSDSNVARGSDHIDDLRALLAEQIIPAAEKGA